MKRSIIKVLTIISLFLLAVPAFANNNFEGTMTLSRSEGSTSATDEIDLTIKNNKVAINISDKSSAPKMVFDMSTGEFSSLVSQGGQKVLIRMNVKSLSAIGGVSALLGAPYNSLTNEKGSGDVKVETINKTETVNGYKTNQVLITSDENITTLWVTKEIPFDFFAVLNMLNFSEELSPLSNTFPLKGTVKDLKTDKTSSFSITVNQKDIDEKAFEFPEEGFQVMNIDPLIQQMVNNNDPAQIKRVLENMLKR